MSKDIIKGAVIGYGAAFNMGKHHANAMKGTRKIELVAVCDVDPKRTQAAKQDFPGINTYNDLDEMLVKEEFDLIAVVLPHNLHASVAVKCLKAGKHVIVEKPMCITIAEATEMINTAREQGKMLTVYHNRRWDADFNTLRRIIKKGLIGDVFHVEMFGGGYGRPNPNWWRSVKSISGGAFYDWGAHYLDWLLNIIPSHMVNVTGFYNPNLVWDDISNEDHVEAVIRFANGAMADVIMSSVAKATKPRWWVLGTKGAVISQGGGFKVYSEVKGQPKEQVIPNDGNAWKDFYSCGFYENVVAHLTKGEELIVKPEEARRVIAIMDLAEKSSKTHQAEAVPYEFEVKL
jgi:predicted dehydrogenase